MGGVSCICGLWIPVATVLAMVADGMTIDEITADYPDPEPEDVREALRYAAGAVSERMLSRVAVEIRGRADPLTVARAPGGDGQGPVGVMTP